MALQAVDNLLVFLVASLSGSDYDTALTLLLSLFVPGAAAD
jgi:hypothetical protein